MLQSCMYLVSIKFLPIANPPVVLPCIAVLNYFGMCIITATAFSAPVQHYPSRRGKAIALVKSFVGLGAAVVSQSFVMLFGWSKDHQADPKSLYCILLWAACSLLATTFSGVALPEKPDRDATEPCNVLTVLFWELLLLGVVSAGISLIPYGQLHDLLVPCIIVLTLLPIAIVLYYPSDIPEENHPESPDLPPRGRALCEASPAPLSHGMHRRDSNPDTDAPYGGRGPRRPGGNAAHPRGPENPRALPLPSIRSQTPRRGCSGLLGWGSSVEGRWW